MVLTIEEAARLLRISRGSAYEAARSNQIPTIRIGRRLLVPRAKLLALLGEDTLTGGLTPSARQDGGKESEQ
jgi:excisionase family DNA binding protein